MKKEAFFPPFKDESERFVMPPYFTPASQQEPYGVESTPAL